MLFIARDAPTFDEAGYQMLIRNKKEPWGQIVSRFNVRKEQEHSRLRIGSPRRGASAPEQSTVEAR